MGTVAEVECHGREQPAFHSLSIDHHLHDDTVALRNRTNSGHNAIADEWHRGPGVSNVGQVRGSISGHTHQCAQLKHKNEYLFELKCFSELVRRLRTLTLTLLPIEVPLDSISDPTSRIITPQVIQAYIAAAGDLTESVSSICQTRFAQN